MGIETIVAAAVALVLSALLTETVRRLAQRHGFIDLPNARSSHIVPTPRGGGVAIVISTILALGALVLMGRVDTAVFAALAGGGALVAAVGFVDDRRPVSARVRLAVHFGAALWALAWLGGLPPLQLGERVVSFGLMGYPLGAIGIVWVLNLFNFMDGIDGIAASEAIFVAGAAAGLSMAGALSGGEATAASVVFFAACLGFLISNWPPARIFMGDVGSGFLGYFIAVIAIVMARESAAGLLVCLILGSVFFVDATVTLVRRLLRGERVSVPHRNHAYQWLARRWKSHKRVTVLVLIVNFLWLLPMAFLASTNPQYALWATLSAIVPLVLAAILAGAGRSEG